VRREPGERGGNAPRRPGSQAGQRYQTREDGCGGLGWGFLAHIKHALGVPFHYEKLRREDVQPLMDKILKKIAGWRGKLLSQAAKLTLIRTFLASIPVYLLSFIKFPKWAIKILNLT
jgi:hypothetical protein